MGAVFVLHHPANIERRKKLEEELGRQKVQAEWIEDFSADDLAALDPPKLLELYDQHAFLKKGDKQHWCIAPKISLKHVSVLLKHFEAIKLIVERGLSNALILEDDVILEDNLLSKLAAHLEQMDSEEWDLLSIGDGNPAMHHPDHKEGSSNTSYKNYKKIWTAGPIYAVSATNLMRSADAYVLSQRGASELHRMFLPTVFPIDNHLNYLLNSLNLSVYWAGTLTCMRSRVLVFYTHLHVFLQNRR